MKCKQCVVAMIKRAVGQIQICCTATTGLRMGGVWGWLGIGFSCLSAETYVVTPQEGRNGETVLMIGRNMCFSGGGV